MRRIRSWQDLVDHVHYENPDGRGRPYGLPRLIQLAEGRKRPPGRITDDMRLKLAVRLEAAGVRYDRVLCQGERDTRLWIEQPIPS